MPIVDAQVTPPRNDVVVADEFGNRFGPESLGNVDDGFDHHLIGAVVVQPSDELAVDLAAGHVDAERDVVPSGMVQIEERGRLRVTPIEAATRAS